MVTKNLKYRIMVKEINSKLYYKIQSMNLYNMWDDYLEKGSKLIYTDFLKAENKIKLLEIKKDLNSNDGWLIT